MKRQSLVAKPTRKFKCTTDSKHRLPVAPNQKWVLSSDKRRLEYLAVVIDLYSRQVVGWSINTRMTATLVCDALSVSLFRRGMPEGGLSIVIEVANIVQKTTEINLSP